MESTWRTDSGTRWGSGGNSFPKRSLSSGWTRVQALLGEAVPVLLGLPDIEVAQTALGPLDGQVDDEALRRLVAQAIDHPLVEGASIGTSWVKAYRTIPPGS